MQWHANWIRPAKSYGSVCPAFRKTFFCPENVVSAALRITAMGVYEASLNGSRVGDFILAPGWTVYQKRLQVQQYELRIRPGQENELTVLVGKGWYRGRLAGWLPGQNSSAALPAALTAELTLRYPDGHTDTICTDASWQTAESAVRFSELYDGETYDAAFEPSVWTPAVICDGPTDTLIEQQGEPVREQERIAPARIFKTPAGEIVVDFGQNLTGYVEIALDGVKGEAVELSHAEVLGKNGNFYTENYRSAKAKYLYFCKDGAQRYKPKLTFYGFRYIRVDRFPCGAEHAAQENFTAIAVHSDMKRTGYLSCSDPLLNKLFENVIWGQKSNLLDVPTDCPQRDERMGWTGDIAVFAPTAAFNFDMNRFLDKWLLDVQAEQLPTGGLPNTVPVQGYGFPATMPKMAVAWWGDACVLVPWAQYMARGDVGVLRRMYPTMKKYVNACRFWCGFGFGKHRYLWEMPGILGFGDWVAPDVPQMSQWQGRIKWTGTASLCNTSALLAKIADILGETQDAKHYRALSEKTADAYCSILTDGNGKLLEEFQTAYVLPIYLNMFPTQQIREKAAANLAALAKRNDWCIGTGFPGTPYILFALCDNGQVDAAYHMLLNTKCPSWLYEVKAGATTIWERWDGLDENGVCPIGDDGTDKMISYNHYASGAVGDFLYRRIAGIEPTEAGYKTFRVKPILGGGLTSASAKVRTPYGDASVQWETAADTFTVTVCVPIGTRCELTLPDGTSQILASGTHTATCSIS
mgnify:CR=1 FL=1